MNIVNDHDIRRSHDTSLGTRRAKAAPEYAVVNYVNREFNPKLFVGFRSDLLNDKKGQRTGISGKYTENTLYATKYIGNTIMLRPELRFDHSWDARGYDNGTARNQFFFGMDVIYKF